MLIGGVVGAGVEIGTYGVFLVQGMCFCDTVSKGVMRGVVRLGCDGAAVVYARMRIITRSRIGRG